ncbi:MAG: hypothetical protein ACO2ZM_02035 [Francisellaceae bacterium]
MNIKKTVRLAVCLITTLSLSACGGGGGGESDSNDETSVNVSTETSVTMPEYVATGKTAMASVQLEATNAEQYAFSVSNITSKAVTISSIDMPTFDKKATFALTNKDAENACWNGSNGKTLNAGDSCDFDFSINSNNIEDNLKDNFIVNFSNNTHIEIPFYVSFVDSNDDRLENAPTALDSTLTLLPNGQVNIEIENNSNDRLNNLALTIPDALKDYVSALNDQIPYLDKGQSATLGFTLSGNYYAKMEADHSAILDDLKNNLTSKTLYIQAANSKKFIPELNVYSSPISINDNDETLISFDDPLQTMSLSLDNTTSTSLTIESITKPDGVSLNIKEGQTIAKNSQALLEISLASTATSGDIVIVSRDANNNKFTNTIPLNVDNSIDPDLINISTNQLSALSDVDLKNVITLTNDAKFAFKPSTVTSDYAISTFEGEPDLTVDQNSSCLSGNPVLPGDSCELIIDTPAQSTENSRTLTITSPQLQSPKTQALNLFYTDIAMTNLTSIPQYLVKSDIPFIQKSQFFSHQAMNNTYQTDFLNGNTLFNLDTSPSDACQNNAILEAGNSCTAYSTYTPDQLGTVNTELTFNFINQSGGDNYYFEIPVTFDVVDANSELLESPKLLSDIELAPGITTSVSFENISNSAMNNVQLKLADWLKSIVKPEDLETLQINQVSPGNSHTFTFTLLNTPEATDTYLSHYDELINNETTGVLTIDSASSKTLAPKLTVSASPFQFDDNTINSAPTAELSLKNLTNHGFMITSVSSNNPTVSYDNNKQELPLSLASDETISLPFTIAANTVPTADDSITIAYQDELNNEFETNLPVSIDNQINSNDLDIPVSYIVIPEDQSDTQTVDIVNNGDFDWQPSTVVSDYVDTANLPSGVTVNSDASTCLSGEAVAPGLYCTVDFDVLNSANNASFDLKLKSASNATGKTNLRNDKTQIITPVYKNLNVVLTSAPDFIVSGGNVQIDAEVMNATGEVKTLSDIAVSGDGLSIASTDCAYGEMASGSSCSVVLNLTSTTLGVFPGKISLLTGDGSVVRDINPEIVASNDSRLPSLGSLSLSPKGGYQSNLTITNNSDETIFNPKVEIAAALLPYVRTSMSTLSAGSVLPGASTTFKLVFDPNFEQYRVENSAALADNATSHLVAISSANSQINYPSISAKPILTATTTNVNEPLLKYTTYGISSDPVLPLGKLTLIKSNSSNYWYLYDKSGNKTNTITINNVTKASDTQYQISGDSVALKGIQGYVQKSLVLPNGYNTATTALINDPINIVKPTASGALQTITAKIEANKLNYTFALVNNINSSWPFVSTQSQIVSYSFQATNAVVDTFPSNCTTYVMTYQYTCYPILYLKAGSTLQPGDYITYVLKGYDDRDLSQKVTFVA